MIYYILSESENLSDMDNEFITKGIVKMDLEGFKWEQPSSNNAIELYCNVSFDKCNRKEYCELLTGKPCVNKTGGRSFINDILKKLFERKCVLGIHIGGDVRANVNFEVDGTVVTLTRRGNLEDDDGEMKSNI